GEFSEPLNIRCSKRWAKPVLPLGSCFEPTPYQIETATTGALRSVCTTTRRPLSRVNCSYGMSTSLASSPGDAGAACAPARGSVPTAAKASAMSVNLSMRNPPSLSPRAGYQASGPVGQQASRAGRKKRAFPHHDHLIHAAAAEGGNAAPRGLLSSDG